MSLLQLNPMLPVTCPKGKGYAFAMIDYSQEHDILFCIAIDGTGEIWTYRNSEVRFQKNVSMGRFVELDLPTLQTTLNKNQFPGVNLPLENFKIT